MPTETEYKLKGGERVIRNASFPYVVPKGYVFYITDLFLSGNDTDGTAKNSSFTLNNVVFFEIEIAPNNNETLSHSFNIPYFLEEESSIDHSTNANNHQELITGILIKKEVTP